MAPPDAGLPGAGLPAARLPDVVLPGETPAWLGAAENFGALPAGAELLGWVPAARPGTTRAGGMLDAEPGLASTASAVLRGVEDAPAKLIAHTPTAVTRTAAAVSPSAGARRAVMGGMVARIPVTTGSRLGAGGQLDDSASGNPAVSERQPDRQREATRPSTRGRLVPMNETVIPHC